MSANAVNRRLPGSTTDVAIKDSWQTPPQIFAALNDVFHFSLDAAASDLHHLCELYFTMDNDALSTDWGAYLEENNAPTRTVWVNPPFSNMGSFIDTAIRQSKKGITTVLVSNWDHSSAWCSRALMGASEVWLVTGYFNDDMQWRSGRMRFVHPSTGKPAADQPKPQALFIFRDGKIGESMAQIKAVPLNTIWKEVEAEPEVIESADLEVNVVPETKIIADLDDDGKPVVKAAKTTKRKKATKPKAKAKKAEADEKPTDA
jgi:phage N-6-adenine-methyltransferase